MTQKEANAVMVERFEQLIADAQETDSVEEHIRITDCAHKLFITLTNAGAFEGESIDLAGNGIKN